MVKDISCKASTLCSTAAAIQPVSERPDLKHLSFIEKLFRVGLSNVEIKFHISSKERCQRPQDEEFNQLGITNNPGTFKESIGLKIMPQQLPILPAEIWRTIIYEFGDQNERLKAIINLIKAGFIEEYSMRDILNAEDVFLFKLKRKPVDLDFLYMICSEVEIQMNKEIIETLIQYSNDEIDKKTVNDNFEKYLSILKNVTFNQTSANFALGKLGFFSHESDIIISKMRENNICYDPEILLLKHVSVKNSFLPKEEFDKIYSQLVENGFLEEIYKCSRFEYQTNVDIIEEDIFRGRNISDALHQVVLDRYESAEDIYRDVFNWLIEDKKIIQKCKNYLYNNFIKDKYFEKERPNADLEFLKKEIDDFFEYWVLYMAYERIQEIFDNP